MQILIDNKPLLDNIARRVFNTYKNIEYEDLKQEAFLKGMEIINSFDNNKASISTYLYNNILGHLSNKCKKLYTYQSKKESCTISVRNNFENLENVSTYLEDFNAIILRTDMNKAPQNIQNCLKTIYSMPVKKSGRGIGLKTTYNEVLNEMENRGIPESKSTLLQTKQYFNSWNEVPSNK